MIVWFRSGSAEFQDRLVELLLLTEGFFVRESAEEIHARCESLRMCYEAERRFLDAAEIRQAESALSSGERLLIRKLKACSPLVDDPRYRGLLDWNNL